jgi:NADH-quinone oxidoreductase subunit C
MNDRTAALGARMEERLQARVTRVASTCGELTFEVAASDWAEVARTLRDDPDFAFESLIDLCGVDYLDYGRTEWQTFAATDSGFSRGVKRGQAVQDHFNAAHPPEDAAGAPTPGRRFAVVCHLLSLQYNVRVRMRSFCADDDRPMIASLVEVWASANWFEREAFDLFGILFRNHPDLRRILTDYGFIGHPFRKDFPLIGHTEVRYDPVAGRVVYEPVSIVPRTLVPRVIREDHRYQPEIHDETSFREIGNRA